MSNATKLSQRAINANDTTSKLQPNIVLPQVVPLSRFAEFVIACHITVRFSKAVETFVFTGVPIYNISEVKKLKRFVLNKKNLRKLSFLPVLFYANLLFAPCSRVLTFHGSL